MEEIDIIELLKRVKEGKAPKEIEIEGFKFYYNDEYNDLCEIYESTTCYWSIRFSKRLDIKIKILDKPIEELEIGEEVVSYGFNREHRVIYPTTGKICSKINEIIKYINSKEE